MIFAYIKTLDNVHKASSPVVAQSVLERKACCVSVAIAVVIIVCLLGGLAPVQGSVYSKGL